MQLTLGEIADRLGASLEGDSAIAVSGVAGLAEAGPGDVSFLADLRHAEAAETTGACAVLVDREFTGPVSAACLRVDSPYGSFVQLLEIFHVELASPEPGIHPAAVVHPGATLGEGVSLGPCVVLEEGVHVGDGTWIGSGTILGRNVRVGKNCRIHSLVQLRHGVELEDRVIVQAGAVVGSDGFGYVSDASGHRRIPHVGSVRVGNDVEIGANTAIDRGTVGDTVIEDGVKIDNLVHIAHNVVIGQASLVVAQVGISGSTRIGKGVVLGGQAGLVGHIHVGDGARIAGRSAVTKPVAEGSTVSGYPAMDHRRARRLEGHIRKLPDLAAQVKILESRICDLEKSEEGIR
jgi:UDP-3-O-[3-hydroxymyristoyl] glucosamine N-acyltransferase